MSLKEPERVGGPVPEDVLPLKERASLLGERCRVICGGILALVWALLIGDAKEILSLVPSVKVLFVWSAILCVAALLGDYLQVLFQYVDLKNPYRTFGRFLAFGGKVMFVGKQVGTILAVGIFLAAAVHLMQPLEVAEAGTDEKLWNSYWTGEVWTDSATQNRKPSKLIVGEPNPYTGLVPAREDRFDCTGSYRAAQTIGQSTPQLKLTCASGITLIGTITAGAAKPKFSGSWSSSSPASNETGHFQYTYLRKAPDMTY